MALDVDIRGMPTIMLIGAGQIGSRHLQALKKVRIPLDITVIDPSAESLRTAQERYENAPGEGAHTLRYEPTLPTAATSLDIAIVATSSNVRRDILVELLKVHTVKYFILEKLLFHRKEHYAEIEALFLAKGIHAWVNCSMRVTPFYETIRPYFDGTRLFYRMSGGDWGMMCNVIHFIDHLSYYSRTLDYTVDLHLLDPHLLPAKRKGFFELSGTLIAYFNNGSMGIFTSHAEGTAPITFEIANHRARVIVREAERKAWISREEEGWHWREVETVIPYQSELTNLLVEQLLNKGSCHLPTFTDSARLHLQHLEPILAWVNQHSENKFDYYPFT